MQLSKCVGHDISQKGVDNDSDNKAEGDVLQSDLMGVRSATSLGWGITTSFLLLFIVYCYLFI